MMMAGVASAEQKRRSEGFLHLNCEGGGSGGTAASCGAATKRHKAGGGGAPISFRERKDKIGERVAALQQLVSPFGKTDTASVLQEATGYIKFLHEQLEVLSAPYIRTPPIGNSQESDHYNLRSRGLCLVPLSFTNGIASSNGADMWAPVNNTKSPRS